MAGQFVSGDQRINKAGRPRKKRSVAEVLADVIKPEDVEKIARSMKVLALAGDPAAASAVAVFLLAGGHQ